MNIKRLLLFFVINFLSLNVFSQVDINYKMGLLEKNVANSESNFNKYKENLKISVSNFNEATKMVNDLRNLKKQALKDSKRATTNSLTYGQVMEKYTEFIAQEKAEILRENEAVKKLEELIVSIRANTKKREEFVLGYEEEIKKARSEIEKWKDKGREVAGVIEEIDVREKEALSERKKWEDKKEIYRKETKKWAKELGRSRKILSTFVVLRKK